MRHVAKLTFPAASSPRVQFSLGATEGKSNSSSSAGLASWAATYAVAQDSGGPFDDRLCFNCRVFRGVEIMVAARSLEGVTDK